MGNEPTSNMLCLGVGFVIVVIYALIAIVRSSNREKNKHAKQIEYEQSLERYRQMNNEMKSKKRLASEPKKSAMQIQQKHILEHSKQLNGGTGAKRKSTASTNTFPLGPEQTELFNIIESTDETVFITGKAGSGKSYLLHYFVENTSKRVAVVAPTGIAAINVHGQTIHSLFQLDFKVQRPDAEFTLGRNQSEVLRMIDALVIDEVSMVRSDIMEAINRRLQRANDNDRPFGGKQIIMFGDLFQLPPVITDGQVHRYLDDTFGGTFFFSANVFNNIDLKIYELSFVYRQKSKQFISLLNRIRIGAGTDKDMITLNARFLPNEIPAGGYLTITPTNAQADAINAAKLAELNTHEFTFLAKTTGKPTKDFPADLELKLKVGAQILMIKNDGKTRTLNERENQGPRWVNGTLGVVAELGKDKVVVAINGVKHILNKEVWTKDRYRYDAVSKSIDSEPIATCEQYPIKLAWAITIHKAQGQTYQTVAIDFGHGAFEVGQAYVAFSRCVDLEKLYLLSSFRREDIKVSQEVLEFMKKRTKLDVVDDIIEEDENSSFAEFITTFSQGSLAWKTWRSERLTGTDVGRLFSRIKPSIVRSGISPSVLVSQKKIEDSAERKKNSEILRASMERGKYLEPRAAQIVKEALDKKIEHYGGIENSKYPCCGYSPDGVAYDKSFLWENKSFLREHHMKCITGHIDKNIVLQCQWGMFISGIPLCYLSFYNPDIDGDDSFQLIKLEYNTDLQKPFESIVKELQEE